MSQFEEARAAFGAALDAEVAEGLACSTPEELAGFGAALRERVIWRGDGGGDPVVCCVADEVPHAAVAAGVAVAVVAPSGGSSPTEAAAALRSSGLGVFAADVLCPPWGRLRDALAPEVAVAGALLAPVEAVAHVVVVEDDVLAERVLRALCRLDHRRAIAVAPGGAMELCDGAVCAVDSRFDLAALCVYAAWRAPTPAAGAQLVRHLPAAA